MTKWIVKMYGPDAEGGEEDLYECDSKEEAEREMEYEASGEDYILTTEKEIADKNNMRRSHVKGRYIAFPEAGYVYDFRDASQPVWVCGKPYSTVVNGQSGPVDVQGKQIKISGVNKGDATEFARIWFKVEESI